MVNLLHYGMVVHQVMNFVGTGMIFIRTYNFLLAIFHLNSTSPDKITMVNLWNDKKNISGLKTCEWRMGNREKYVTGFWKNDRLNRTLEVSR